MSGKYTTQQLARKFGITPRSIQRTAKKYGVIRTLAESNKDVAPLKNYYRMPKELKVVRKQITNKLRYEILSAQPWCTQCGSRSSDGVRLEVNHIDDDPTNNKRENLQVLCMRCNLGKSHLDRFGSTAA